MTRVLLLATVMLAIGGSADAYRMFKVSVPDSYAVKGTMYPGISETANNFSWNAIKGSTTPVFWENPDTVGIWLGNLSDDFMFSEPQEDALDNSAIEWNSEIDSFVVTFKGLESGYNEPSDGKNKVFFWADSTVGSWARTLITYETTVGNDYGEIVEFDIWMNDDVEWTNDTQDCSGDEKDIQTVFTHEIGHGLGFAHPSGPLTCSSSSDYYTMRTGCAPPACVSYDESLDRRTLEQDDLNGIDEVYGTGNAGGSDGISVSSEQGVDKPVGQETEQATPITFRVSSYPNPVNAEVMIEFTLTEPQPVVLRVYNLAGQVIHTVVDGQTFAQGTHAVRWDSAVDKVAAGRYLLEVTTPVESATTVISLVK